MRNGARGAMQSRQATKFLKGWGKMWKSGMKARVYFPIFYNEEMESYDIVAAATWGHAVCLDKVALKRVFIPSLAEIDEFGKPKNSDALLQFSRISRLFDTAKFEREVYKINKHTKHSAEKKQALIALEKEKLEKVETALGKLTMLISTECVFVPLEKDTDRPLWDEAGLTSVDLSDERITDLIGACKDKKSATEHDSKFIEVEFTFGTTNDRKKDGKVKPALITEEFRLINQYPDDEAKVTGYVSRMPEDADIILARNSSHHKLNEADIITALTNYTTSTSEDLDYLQLTDELAIGKLARAEAIIERLGIVFESEDLVRVVEEKREELSKDKEKDAPTIDGITAEDVDKEKFEDTTGGSAFDNMASDEFAGASQV